jgi:hypothetical protein
VRLRPFAVFLLLLFASFFTKGQSISNAISSDPQAAAALQRSLTAMGPRLPSDSVASGLVIIVAGSQTQSGSVRILTRGVDQSFEEITTPLGIRQSVFSRGAAASATEGAQLNQLPIELALSSQSPDFPLPLLANIVSSADVAAMSVMGNRETIMRWREPMSVG